MNRRTGVTLTEVLIAIFIMAIGLMALLSLFPLGAAQMAQALKDQRTAETAANAGSVARMLWKEACVVAPNNGSSNPQFYDTTSPGITAAYKAASAQRFAYAMDDPNLNNLYQNTSSPNQYPYALPADVPAATVGGQTYVSPYYPDMVRIPDNLPPSEAQKTHSSYPVFVDPIGWMANQSAPARRLWVGHPLSGAPIAQNVGSGQKTGLIPRRPLYVRNPDPGTSPRAPWVPLGVADADRANGQLINPYLSSRQRLLSQFSLADDYTFNPDGTLKLNGTLAERQGRYTWAYLFRRQNNNKDNRSNVEVTVVVYSGRSMDVPTPEQQFLVTTQGLRSVSIDLAANGGRKPALRRGGWVLDATIFEPGTGAPRPIGTFYRVVNVDDTTIPGVVQLDFQKDMNFPPVRKEQRILVVMDNVVEVFPKGVVSLNSPPGDYRPDDLDRIAND